MAGEKREPSSFVPLTSMVGPFVSSSLACRVRSNSRPPSTPSTPSNLPPVGCVSRCEPIQIGGRSRRPARVANMLPTSSTPRVQPSASHCERNQSRTRLSSSDSVSRLMPPFAVAPIFAVAISESHRRCGSICRLGIAAGALMARPRGAREWTRHGRGYEGSRPELLLQPSSLLFKHREDHFNPASAPYCSVLFSNQTVTPLGILL